MKKGFTLIETIGVLIVIALIAIVTVPIIIDSNDRNMIQEQEKADIISALDFYFARHPEIKRELVNNGSINISKDDLVNEGFITEIKYYNNIHVIYNSNGTYEIESGN